MALEKAGLECSLGGMGWVFGPRSPRVVFGVGELSSGAVTVWVLA